jgi:hypothetical protein
MDFNHPTFIRYGGLSSVLQKGERGMPNNPHQAPANRGIFAFVKGFVEPFLLGTDKIDARRQEYIRDKDGNIITPSHPEYDDYINDYFGNYTPKKSADSHATLKNGELSLLKNKRPKEFKYDGPIWSHLEYRMKPADILARKGAWVLTDMKAYIQALKKEVGAYKVQQSLKGYTFTIDHMEVFIEKV